MEQVTTQDGKGRWDKMDEDKKKKKKIDLAGIGGFVAKVIKYGKYLTNPVIFWIAVVILIIILIVVKL